MTHLYRSRAIWCWAWLSVIALCCSEKIADAQTPAADQPAVLHLLPPNPEKKALLIFEGESEADAGKVACTKFGFKYDRVKFFDIKTRDYRMYHTVICGSNAMNFFGSEETKKPEAFDPLAKFVSEGGHLIVCGTFNAVNMEHLKRYGVETGFQHCDACRPTPATAMFYEGCENLVPPKGKLHSAGNFVVNKPHVNLLMRSGSYEDQPVVATIEDGRGRVTVTVVEPGWIQDEWLITVLLNWAWRGGPTPGFLPAQGSLLAVPDAAAIKAAETLLHDAYKKEYARINQPTGKLAWARMLIDQDFSKEANPAVEYVAWTEVRENAAAVGEVDLAFKAVDLLGGTYQVDVIQSRIDTLTALNRSTKDKDVVKAAARQACELLARTIREDRYAVTGQVVTVARALAQKAQDKHLQTLVGYYDKRGKALAREYQKIASAADLLKKSQYELGAKSEVGRFYCFVKDDWAAGLRLLAQGQDATCKDLAGRELANPTKSDEMVALADDWWSFGETLATDQRATVWRHAETWYQRALPTLSGLVKSSLLGKLTKIPPGKAQLVFRIKSHQGSSSIVLNPQSLTFRNQNGTLPEQIGINDFDWDCKSQNPLTNDGASRVLVDGIDVYGAKLTQLAGREKVVLEPSPEGLKISIPDEYQGTDDYEFRLAFGK